MADLYVARSILKLVKFLSTVILVSAGVALLAHVIGPENAGTVCVILIGIYAAYHFVITDAEQSRIMDNLNAKYSKKD